MKKSWIAGAVSVMVCMTMLEGFGAMTGLAAGRADLSGEIGGPGAKTGETEAVSMIEPQNLEAAAAADQLIVVIGTGGYHADISYYKKAEDQWSLQWKESGYVGRSGITTDKKEGDGATPAGTYGFNLAFGLKENPESIQPYHQVVSGDVWVDDSLSAHYNCLVNTSQTAIDWNSAENLIEASPYYDYALNTDYNIERIPGKGSAIFLHCFKTIQDQPSSGCICLPEHRVKELIQNVTSDSRIVISPDLQSLK